MKVVYLVQDPLMINAPPAHLPPFNMEVSVDAPMAV